MFSSLVNSWTDWKPHNLHQFSCTCDFLLHVGCQFVNGVCELMSAHPGKQGNPTWYKLPASASTPTCSSWSGSRPCSATNLSSYNQANRQLNLSCAGLQSLGHQTRLDSGFAAGRCSSEGQHVRKCSRLVYCILLFCTVEPVTGS